VAGRRLPLSSPTAGSARSALQCCRSRNRARALHGRALPGRRLDRRVPNTEPAAMKSPGRMHLSAQSVYDATGKKPAA
jgi:hypothetical protein